MWAAADVVVGRRWMLWWQSFFNVCLFLCHARKLHGNEMGMLFLVYVFSLSCVKHRTTKGLRRACDEKRTTKGLRRAKICGATFVVRFREKRTAKALRCVLVPLPWACGTRQIWCFR
jgi:hypothetical protein